MGFFDDILSMSDPVGGPMVADSLGLNKKHKKNWRKKAQKKIDLYNQFIRGGVDLQEELQPRLLALERGKQTDAASLLAQIYKDTLGPASRELSAQANTAQRTADLADFQHLAPGYTEGRLAAENADPRVVQHKAYEDQLLKEAMAQFGLGADMDPTELRKAQQMSRANRSGLGFGQGSENDLLQEALALVTHGEDLRSLRTGNALTALGATRIDTGDPLLAVLGRPSSSLPFAQGAASQAGSRLQPFNAEEPTYGSDLLNAHYADVFSRRNRSAARQQAEYSLYAAGIGAAGSAVGGAGGVAALCWVAREVFGPDDPRWLMFRNWLLTRAPAWFVAAYVLVGPRLAEWLKANPEAKPPLREWMQERIAEYLNPQLENSYAL